MFLNQTTDTTIMSKGKFVDFRKLKEEVGIRRILEHYGLLAGLKEQGDRLTGPCPFCEGESDSFRVSMEKNCYKCFRCDGGGNVLDFVAAREDCSVREAAVSIAGWFGIQAGRQESGRSAKAKPTPKKDRPPVKEPVPESKSPSATQKEEQPRVNPPLTFELKLDPDHPWFAEVGIRPETVEEFGLGFCSKGVMAGRIAFPLHDPDGNLVGYAGRWPGEEPPDGQPLWRYPPKLDLSSLVYPVHRVTAGVTLLLLTDDPLDVVLAWQEGCRHKVAFLSEEIGINGLRALFGLWKELDS